MDGGKWVAGNTSVVMELISTAIKTTGSSVTARNAAVDIAHAAEDYACSDYKCLMLDVAAAVCDLTGAVTAFVPDGKAKTVFGVATSTSYFCITLRNKCKDGNVFGCK